MTGDCYFVGNYGGERKESTHFRISKQLELSLYTNSFYAKPGESIIISGNVKRMNGELVNGDIEVSIPIFGNTTGDSLYGKIVNGEFTVNYSINKNVAAGDYRIDVTGYETTGTEKTSEGVGIASLTVFQTLEKIDIALDSQSIIPGNPFSFKPILSDQSDNQMEGDVAVLIRDENQNKVFQNIVKSGETVEYDIPNNMTPGYYEIEATTDSLSKQRNSMLMKTH